MSTLTTLAAKTTTTLKHHLHPAYPIGLDLGSSTTKAVQLRPHGRGAALEVASAFAILSPKSHDPVSLRRFFRETLRPALDRAGFVGRQAVLSLPSAMMTVQRLRFASADAADLGWAVRESAPRWLRMPLGNAVVRHIDAGEVFENGKSCREVLALAAPRDFVVRYAEACEAGAKLEVISILPEATASLATLAKLDRQQDPTLIRILIDAGHATARAYAARGRTLLFSRPLDISATPEQLHAELGMCRKYLETTFINNPLHETVFTGGRTADREWCRDLAASLNLPARVIGANGCLPWSDHAPTELQTAAQAAGAVWSVAAGLSLIGGADAANTTTTSFAA